MTVRDRLWLFASRAHDDDIWLGKGRANRFSCWSRITPAEGAAMLDIPNVVMIVSDGDPGAVFGRCLRVYGKLLPHEKCGVEHYRLQRIPRRE